MSKWTKCYENDTGPYDDYFEEWWIVTDGNQLFRCEDSEDADFLLSLLAQSEQRILAGLTDEEREQIANVTTRIHEKTIDDKEWAEVWEEFDSNAEIEIDEEFQNEMISKHGEGYYRMDGFEFWDRQKKMIQRLVNAKLKEKNT